LRETAALIYFNKIKKVLSDNFFLRLLIIFTILTAIKILLSVHFPSPIIMGDESSYDQKANIIYQSLNIVLPGYPLVIGVAYLFSPDKIIIYHTMLIVNCIFTSLCIFPAYYFLSKFCSKNFSFLGTILVGLLPSVNGYVFLLMSENLFTVIFIFSIWFIVEYFEKGTLFWKLLAALSVMSLFSIRVMGIAMVFAFLLTVIYKTAYAQNISKPKGLFQNVDIYIILITVSLISWFFISTYVMKNSFFEINPAVYQGSTIFTGVNLVNNLFLIFLTSIREIDFLIISTYFIVFVGLIYLIIKLNKFWFRKINFIPESNSKNDKIQFLIFPVIYVLSSVISFLIMTVIHMRYISIFFEFGKSYQIYGRLLDPIVPGIFLLGLSGLGILIKDEKKWKFFQYAIWIYLLILLGLIISFPTTTLQPVLEIFSISYLYYFNPVFPQLIFLLLFLGVTFILLFLSLKYYNFFYILFSILIIFSILSMFIGFQIYTNNSNFIDKYRNPIGKYLLDHPNPDDEYFMVANEIIDTQGFQMLLFTQFWAPKNIILINNITDISTIPKSNARYIISKKIYNLKKIECVDDPSEKFCLYNF